MYKVILEHYNLVLYPWHPTNVKLDKIFMTHCLGNHLVHLAFHR
jgi:hypothetical protein